MLKASVSMRYAIVSDIHGNLVAFQAVLQDIRMRGQVDRIWCLGDITGYGPEPKKCIETLRQFDHICIAGNHDWGAIEKVNLDDFNSDAATACRWTGHQLSTAEIDYLGNMPSTICEDNFTLAHGSPREPLWEYLLSTYSAQASFDYFESEFCLVGHSHVPLVFESVATSGECSFRELLMDIPLSLTGNRMIINPGSVGQPRDGDPRASYAIYDSNDKVIWHHRVPYDIASTQQRMLDHGLPSRLAARLSNGW